MFRTVLKSKLHGATVTEANILYEGSITIDADLMRAADILEHEQVHVVNLNNGVRLVTYVISGDAGSGIICMNGPAARLCSTGDTIHILSYVSLSDEELAEFTPTVLLVEPGNRISRTHG